jgi:hypothetical protein
MVTSVRDIVVVGNFSDDPFAIDVAYGMGQSEDIADLISMKTFANSEFCPRFISDERDASVASSMARPSLSSAPPRVSRRDRTWPCAHS